MHITGDSRRKRGLLTALVAVVVAVSLLSLPGLAGAVTAPCDPHSDGKDVARHYVCTLYFSYLHSPSDPEVSYWMSVLDTNGALAVSGGIIGSQEAATGYLPLLYSLILGRSPDSGGSAYFTDFLQTGGRVEDVKVLLAASAEKTSSVPDDNTWVGDMYSAILQRTASTEERAYWAGLIANGTLTRSGVAASIVRSAEATTIQVDFLYGFLGRPADGDGAAYWASFIDASGLRAAAIDFFSTPEAYTNASPPVN